MQTRVLGSVAVALLMAATACGRSKGTTDSASGTIGADASRKMDSANAAMPESLKKSDGTTRTDTMRSGGAPAGATTGTGATGTAGGTGMVSGSVVGTSGSMSGTDTARTTRTPPRTP